MDLITKDSNTTQVLFSSLDRVLENVEYNKFKISVRASVALTKLAKHSDADQSFR